MYDRDGYACTGELCQYICDQNYLCLGKTYDGLAALGFQPQNGFFEEHVVRCVDYFYCIIDAKLYRSACDSTTVQLAAELPFKQVNPQQLLSADGRLFVAQSQFLYEYDQISGDVAKCGRLSQNVGVFSVADRHFVQIYGGPSKYELYAMRICPEFLSTSEEFALSPLTSTRSLQFARVATLDACLQCFQAQLSTDLERSLDFELPSANEPPATVKSEQVQLLPEF